MTEIKKELVSKILYGYRIGEGPIAEILKGPIKDIIKKLKECVEKAEKEGFKDIELVWGHYCGTKCYEIKGWRLETDAEFNRRKSQIEKIELEERTEYERLKKKYG